jgi:hypothetical protein
MIFGNIGERLQSLKQSIRFPLYDCPICMTPWHGTVWYWIIYHGSIKEGLIVVIVAMGVNATLVKLFDR